jgi:predicted dehydrogenase
MIEACRNSGTRLAINHQMRFMEQYQRPKALVNSSTYGGLGSIIVSAGNFGMAMNGTHYFEMFRYLTDEVPVSVNAWFSPEALPNPRGPQFIDAAGSVRITTASGKRFYLDCSPDQGHGMFVTYNCRNGRIDIDELSGQMTMTVRDEQHRDMPTTRYGMPYSAKTEAITPADAVAPTRSVLEALLTGDNYPTGEDGRLAMQALVAAHVSNRRGGSTVRLDDPEVVSHGDLPIA